MKPRYFVCDFETSVFEQQEYTEVWAFAMVELFDDQVLIFHSLEEGFEYLRSLNQNVILYFHNLKFDGSFWLDFLLIQKHYKQSYVQIGDDVNTLRFNTKKDMKNNEFTYSISNLGQWYRILIKTNKHFIEIKLDGSASGSTDDITDIGSDNLKAIVFSPYGGVMGDVTPLQFYFTEAKITNDQYEYPNLDNFVTLKLNSITGKVEYAGR